jgi:hypothetical protein
MAKKSPLEIANLMGQAAQQKAQQPNDGDADDAKPGKKSPKQVAAAKEQEKSKGKKPPQSKKPPMQGGM